MTPGRPRVLKTIAELRAAVREARAAGKKIGLVPTMGALHAGHISLAAESAKTCDFTIVTVFVNPTQFGPHEDFSKYPRDLDRDVQSLAALPVDAVFAPSADEVYPKGYATTVEVEGPALPLEGDHRPGHFEGVATVVLKLFNMAAPDVAFFGQKDFQQSLVVRRMTIDLNLPIEIRVLPIVRESDGLALSSRNVYLSPDERSQALVLSRGLRLARELVASGERQAASILRKLRELIAAQPAVKLEYLVIADPDTLAEVETIDRSIVVLIAARVGSTRLIDNEMIDV